ncbi:hypothetical protein [Luteimonas wenzhouensis]|uniref:Uncharacterized protein n=1 Tax=Luteimonas wenzhouensis TaxID=2599615 RepID=A0A5C5TYF4_9GAMM|nr:hypothetical protein [Luteimonas wenzhouensis]TWT18744.1 hypothetical protein FQY79_08825 [Luteimonas wenzhouensis]
MHLFQGVFFLILGVGLLVVDWRSLSLGWLPCGPNGFKGRLVFRRNEQPLRYWILFVAYAAAGVGLVVYAVRVLLGQVEPLPLN